jgi:hypothetical protein
MILSKLIEIFKKQTDFDKKQSIYRNGDDNNYPEIIDRLINNSVTAKRGVSIVKTFILGKGFVEKNDMIVNEDKNLTLFQFCQLYAESVARQGGAFIHINYYVDGSIRTLDVLPYSHCRIGKKDDNDYYGKIVVKDWEDAKSEPKCFDVYNDRMNVLFSQFERDGIENYKGQVLFVNPSPFVYPLSKLDPVCNDADSEAQVSVYKNISLRKGFFGKQLVITAPFTDGSMDPTSREYQEAMTERGNFRKNLKEFVGASNADGLMHLEMDLMGEDIEKTIVFKTIDSNIDDRIFAHTEESISNNIAIAFGVPQALIKPNNGSLFSASAESILQMKKFVQEETTSDRELMEIVINKLLKRCKNYIGDYITITKLIPEQNANQEE